MLHGHNPRWRCRLRRSRPASRLLLPWVRKSHRSQPTTEHTDAGGGCYYERSNLFSQEVRLLPKAPTPTLSVPLLWPPPFPHPAIRCKRHAVFLFSKFCDTPDHSAWAPLRPLTMGGGAHDGSDHITRTSAQATREATRRESKEHLHHAHTSGHAARLVPDRAQPFRSMIAARRGVESRRTMLTLAASGPSGQPLSTLFCNPSRPTAPLSGHGWGSPQPPRPRAATRAAGEGGGGSGEGGPTAARPAASGWAGRA